jgi:hypothetical protein
MSHNHDDDSQHLKYFKKNSKRQFNAANSSNLKFLSFGDNSTLFPTFGKPAYEVADVPNPKYNYQLSSIGDINDSQQNNSTQPQILNGGRLRNSKGMNSA